MLIEINGIWLQNQYNQNKQQSWLNHSEKEAIMQLSHWYGFILGGAGICAVNAIIIPPVNADSLFTFMMVFHVTTHVMLLAPKCAAISSAHVEVLPLILLWFYVPLSLSFSDPPPSFTSLCSLTFLPFWPLLSPTLPPCQLLFWRLWVEGLWVKTWTFTVRTDKSSHCKKKRKFWRLFMIVHAWFLSFSYDSFHCT